MHESMVAQKLLAAIAQEAEMRNLKPISAKISCGKFYAINDEILNFAFEAICKRNVTPIIVSYRYNVFGDPIWISVKPPLCF